MHIAVTRPLCISSDQLDPALIEKEREISREQLVSAKKPAAMIEKILDGKIRKFYEEVCLLNQKFIKNDKISIQKHLDEMSKKLGITLHITSFTRFAIGKK